MGDKRGVCHGYKLCRTGFGTGWGARQVTEGWECSSSLLRKSVLDKLKNFLYIWVFEMCSYTKGYEGGTSAMKTSCCGQSMTRTTSDLDHDVWKVARWRCKKCKRAYTQRLRKEKGHTASRALKQYKKGLENASE